MCRRAWTTTLAAILCVATVYVTAACRRKTDERPGLAVPNPRPVSLVAALGERLAVLASVNGGTSYVDGPMSALYPSHERASGVRGQFTDVSGIAVTAEGRSLIVVNGARDCRTKGGFEQGSYQPEIDHVVMETGARERVVGGSDFPAVNAKGVVAYGPVCDGIGTLGFTDLVTGWNARRGAFGESAESSLPIASVRPLAWLSDGRTLFYAVSVRGEAHTRYYFGLVWPFVPPKEEVFRRVAAALDEAGLDPTAAALVDDTTIAFAQDDSAGSQVREWDVSTDRFRADRGFHLPETITALTTDPSGTHFLVVTRSHALYRWSVGDTSPTRLAGGVGAAAWLR